MAESTHTNGHYGSIPRRARHPSTSEDCDFERLLQRADSDPTTSKKRQDEKRSPFSSPPPKREDIVRSLSNAALSTASSNVSGDKPDVLNVIVISLINSIMCIPCLYGYASVIFIHPAFEAHINALSKLVLFSSIVHQICFSLFSTLPFAIGQVQDAGLIFLSGMARIIADKILDRGGSEDEIVSTTIVLLGLSTTALGGLLVVMGKFRLADAVSYLPMPVVGGYLAFIGYFCVEAGVAMSISEPMVGLEGWLYLFNPEALMLAIPGIIMALMLVWVQRHVTSDAAIPLLMVGIPALFYAIIYACGAGIEGAREDGWIGPHSPPIPAKDVFSLVQFHLVQWDLIYSIIPTWAGMVFVVSFSSCLDVAAISMDMGEALDTNAELVTVGISNVCSGLCCGFTGSYIFSQTLFTYRSGITTRWCGILVLLTECAVFFCTVNLLEVSPLFFLGGTLTFVGFDLLYEWLVEVRHKLVMSEYGVLIATFVAIQIIGIDAGVLFGVIIAVIDFVVTTARQSSLTKVSRRSRTIWSTNRRKLVEEHGYHTLNPKIVCFEMKGSIFFGSSLQLLSEISEAIGIKELTKTDRDTMIMMSPRHIKITPSDLPKAPALGCSSPYLKGRSAPTMFVEGRKPLLRGQSIRPYFVVLDLTQVNFVDASASRGCFLQLSKICARRDIFLIASGANAQVDWMLRSHDVAYSLEEENDIKKNIDGHHVDTEAAKVLLFETVYEALEFCESKLIDELEKYHRDDERSRNGLCDAILPQNRDLTFSSLEKHSLPAVLAHFLGLEEKDMYLLDGFSNGNGESFHEELEYNSGDVVFSNYQKSDGFYIILAGSVGVLDPSRTAQSASPKIVSGAGVVPRQRHRRKPSFQKNASKDALGDVAAILKVGAVFGFVEFILEKERTFSAITAQENTVLARISREGIRNLKQHPEVDRIVDKVLLQASILELANGPIP